MNTAIPENIPMVSPLRTPHSAERRVKLLAGDEVKMECVMLVDPDSFKPVITVGLTRTDDGLICHGHKDSVQKEYSKVVQLGLHLSDENARKLRDALNQQLRLAPPYVRYYFALVDDEVQLHSVPVTQDADSPDMGENFIKWYEEGDMIATPSGIDATKHDSPVFAAMFSPKMMGESLWRAVEKFKREKENAGSG